MHKLAVTVSFAVLAGCQQHPDPGARWLDRPSALATPAASGSRFPHLAAQGGVAVMSWLEPGARQEYALRYSRFEAGAWTAPATVAAGRDWFVNWADFPSVVPVNERLWAAHWLQQKPGDVYSYDVRIAVSKDGGGTWSPPFSPHDDGTPTEHGFVTLLPLGHAAQAIWLDGRHTSGEHEHAAGGAAGAMTLRGAVIGADGSKQSADVEIDGRTCDCCQTDAALTHEGAVVVYRDRSADETRDIAVARWTADGWSEPVHVSSDGWHINGCPVNGPAIDARGDEVVVAWFTAPDRPRVRVAFSSDGGRTFAPPVEVASGAVAGRVDTVLLPDGRAAVSWLADEPGAAEIRAQAFDRDGPAGAIVTVATSDVARSSGFPQMALVADGLLFAWTAPGDPAQVRAAFARLR
jgi:hypothetical protein